MASAAEETDAGIELCLSSIERLRAKFPGHKLLRYADTFATMSPPNEFVEQFGGEHIPVDDRDTEWAAAHMFSNYYKALQAAL
jgi:hypothetical protein